jgi:hypothetical protein
MTIKNFEVLKKQLQELHPILNAFNSETVQLRIVELIFGAELDAAEPVSRSEETPQAQAAISQKVKRQGRGCSTGEQSTQRSSRFNGHSE